MNKTLISRTVAGCLALWANVTFAGADCPQADESTWLSKLDMQKRIVNEYGFVIKLFKVDGDCYEIYGWEDGKDGKPKKIEVYFNPVNGEIVKKK